MCTGKLRFVRVFAALFSISMVLSCGGRGKASSASSVAEAGFDVQKELSGIWYHSGLERITTVSKDTFSWGVTEYDYWKALRIDLLGGQRTLGFADATWDNVTAEVDSQSKNTIRLHLRQEKTPASDEATITVEGKGVISLRFDVADTGTTRMMSGKFFRTFDPSKAPGEDK